MKIGILTFHWAANYGAVLQAYALQTYLESQGHIVEIINYKPQQYDNTLYGFLRERKFMRFIDYIQNTRKENAIECFRRAKLKRTQRVCTCDEIDSIASQFDAIISGSDQLLNPSFLCNGDGKGRITPSYFLGFPYVGKKIGYALSFGCVTYPERERVIAARYISCIDCMSVREASGVDIVKSMGREDAIVVPDPTLLMESSFYRKLAYESPQKIDSNYVYSFFIRHISERKPVIKAALSDKTVLWNNEDGDYTMQGWLSKIDHAEFVVTDSFHCVVMCLKLRTPFVVVTEMEGNVGMNDRFYTLLRKVGMEKNIVYKGEVTTLLTTNQTEIDWKKVDKVLTENGEIGKKYLMNSLN
ncbi:polysaccharide pyruvyl transferase family protein [Bacteroides congonensis]